MTKTYSDCDLIQYLYKELSAEEIASMTAHMKWNMDTQDRYNSLLESTYLLNILKRTPSDTSVQLIMEYSKKSKPLAAAI